MLIKIDFFPQTERKLLENRPALVLHFAHDLTPRSANGPSYKAN